MGQPTIVTLEDMLRARDERSHRQQELVSQYQDGTLLVATIVAPGSEKRNRNTRIVASALQEELDRKFGGRILHRESYDRLTGYELFMVLDIPEDDVKSGTCAIEDHHPLGRLMDIDVIGKDLRPISRSRLGLPGRGCLVCGDDARVCMRAQRHSYEEILAKITQMTDAYVSRV